MPAAIEHHPLPLPACPLLLCSTKTGTKNMASKPNHFKTGTAPSGSPCDKRGGRITRGPTAPIRTAEFIKVIVIGLGAVPSQLTVQALNGLFPDGSITFGGGDVATTARSLGRVLSGLPRVAPFFADLDPSAGGGLFVSATADAFTANRRPWPATVDWKEMPLPMSETSEPSVTAP